MLVAIKADWHGHAGKLGIEYRHNDRYLVRDHGHSGGYNHPIQEERRDLWRRHNSLQQTRPLIYVRAFAWQEMPESICMCQYPFYCAYESHFRNRLFWGALDEDSIFEPWVTVSAVYASRGWGVEIPRMRSDTPTWWDTASILHVSVFRLTHYARQSATAERSELMNVLFALLLIPRARQCSETGGARLL